jgi:hypothetical protein
VIAPIESPSASSRGDRGRFRSSLRRRTYFNNPLIEESLTHLPAALEHPTRARFRDYLVRRLHYNSENTRKRFAEYISERFSIDGAMNLDLARAIKRFNGSQAARAILYFELLRSVPLLLEIAASWLAELPETGGTRAGLLAFLEPRLGGRSADKVAQAATQAFKRCGKLISPKLSLYQPVWAPPPLEAFCYILARLHAEPTMVRVDLFAGQPIIRAMLWPRPCIEGLLRQAQEAGHISKISRLDQYHQFTLRGTGAQRLNLLLGMIAPKISPMPKARKQMVLFPEIKTAGGTTPTTPAEEKEGKGAKAAQKGRTRAVHAPASAAAGRKRRTR